MYLCKHAEGDTIDFVKAAYENTDIRILGMSDHGPLKRCFINKVTDENRDEIMNVNDGFVGPRMNYQEFLGVYKDSIKHAKEEYPNMKILTAVEIEYIPGHDEYYKELRKNCDYLLLGEHFYYDLDEEKQIDNNHINSENVLKFASSIVEGLNTGLFKIIAHPDNFLAAYISSDGILRKFDENARVASKMIIEACIKNNCLIEYNANGAYRGKYKNYDGTYDYTYPRKEFFELAKTYKDAKFVLGCDAHLPIRLYGNNIQVCLRNIIELGLNCENVKIEKRK